MARRKKEEKPVEEPKKRKYVRRQKEVDPIVKEVPIQDVVVQETVPEATQEKPMKQYSLIIEGVDASGKTTFIEALRKHLGYPLMYHHFQFPIGDTTDERYGFQVGQFHLMFDMIRAATNVGNSFIFDRAHIGEFIYSPTLRNRVPTYLGTLERKNADLPVIIVQVKCDPVVVARRFKETRKTERAPSVQDIAQLQNAFSYYISKSIFKNMSIDTTHDPDPVECVKKVADFIRSI
ncbi:MAG TPA: hypothetical protein PLA71_00130 [Saccharofermentans sp.]|nr:hypothetical protein [Saccharofermentans sp.]